MAAFAQPVPQEATIREVVDSVSLPEGMKLQGLEFRNDSNGDPALFLVISRHSTQKSDEEQVQDLSTMKTAIRRQLRDLDFPLFTHFVFVPAE
jgi:hypothetical protein